MRRGLVYARVSTKEQADKQLSIPAQIEAIEKYADREGIEIVGEPFVDEGISAFHDAHRPSFEAMLQRTSQRDIDLVLVHDQSRFCRDRYSSAVYKRQLRKNGVSVLAVNLPYDPNSVAGVYLEAFDEARSQSESMMTSFHVRKGMTANLSMRDPETGWCYKNGGVPPYGYRSLRVSRGKDSRGKEITKQLWEIDDEGDPPPCEVLKWIIDSKWERKMGYKSITRSLNTGQNPWNKRVLSRKGKYWNPSTIHDVFCRDKLMEYAGYAVWNKSDRTERYVSRPREEWVVVEKAHPALIDESVIEKVALDGRRSTKPIPRVRDSRYLLTGTNAFGDYLYRCQCDNCDSHMISASSRDVKWSYYGCALRVQQKVDCPQKHRVSKDYIDSLVIDGIMETFGNREALEEWKRSVDEVLDGELKDISVQQASIRKERNDLYRKKNNLLKAVEEGLPFAQVKDRIQEIERNLSQLENAEPALIRSLPEFDIDLILASRDVWRKTLLAGGEDAKEIVKQLVVAVTWHPATEEHEIEYAFVRRKGGAGGGSRTFLRTISKVVTYTR